MNSLMEILEDSLSGQRILVADSPYVPKFQEAVHVRRNTSFVGPVDSLEDRLLAEYSACFVSSPELLSAESVRSNFVTPVVYVGSDADIQKLLVGSNGKQLSVRDALNCYNLFDIVNIDDLMPAFKKAISERVQLVKYLENLPEGTRRALLEREYDPPRFATFFSEVRRAYDKHESFLQMLIPDDSEQRYASFDAILIQKVRDWDYCHPKSSHRKHIESSAAQIVLEYLEQRESGERKSPLLGGSVHGQDANADRLSRDTRGGVIYNPYGDFRWRVGRLVRNDGSGDHKEVAMQRYKDALFFNDRDDFRTSLMTRPLNLDDYGRNVSFVLMQDIEGPHLSEVLNAINNEVQNETAEYSRKDLLWKLRKALVKKYVSDLTIWNNAAEADEIKTFVQKPAGKTVIQEYKNRVIDLPGCLKKIAPGLFSEDEGILYAFALDALDAVNTDTENIVRVRDASLRNVLIRFGERVKYDEKGQVNFNIDDVINQLTNGSSVQEKAVNDKFYHIDLHIRYGHVFEDIAHVITAHETAFMIQSKDGATVSDKDVDKAMDEFCDAIERPDLKEDRASRYLMFFYRSVRKLKLYATKYIVNAHQERLRGEISKAVYDRRKREFLETVAHHARSTELILGRFRRLLRSEVPGVERRMVDEWYRNYRSELDEDAANAAMRLIDEMEERYGVSGKQKNGVPLSERPGDLYARVTLLGAYHHKLRSYVDENKLQFENLWKDE